MEPTLVIAEKPPTSLLLLSYLQNDPLPAQNLQLETTEVEPAYSQEDMYKLFALIIGIFILGFIARVIILKERFSSSIATGLIIIGSVAILKFTTVPISILMLLTISIITLLILLTKTRAHLMLFAALVLLSLLFRTTNSPNFVSLSPVILTFGLFGFVSTFFYKFINIYEES
jgi:hypothetical protein